MQTMPTLLLFVVLIGIAPASAEDLGVVGKTYEIEETNLIEHIQMELRAMQDDGRLASEQQRLREQAQARVKRPPGRSLPRASDSRFHHYDPSVTTDYDITDHAGNIVYRAGTTVNPLTYTALTTPIVFFDGEDAVQTTWVREFLGDAPDRYVPLMTNGPVIQLMEEWNVRLYFDQHGRYADQLGVTALPAVVRQDGMLLRVDEIALEETR